MPSWESVGGLGQRDRLHWVPSDSVGIGPLEYCRRYVRGVLPLCFSSQSARMHCLSFGMGCPVYDSGRQVRIYPK
jgi:hypothetical protein